MKRARRHRSWTAQEKDARPASSTTSSSTLSTVARGGLEEQTRWRDDKSVARTVTSEADTPLRPIGDAAMDLGGFQFRPANSERGEVSSSADGQRKAGRTSSLRDARANDRRSLFPYPASSREGPRRLMG